MYDTPVGPVPQNLAAKIGEATAARVARTARPRADAIVVMSTEIYLVEGKIMDINQGLGMIGLYERLIPMTPELKQYLMYTSTSASSTDTQLGSGTSTAATKPIHKVLVAANPPEWAATIAPLEEIELVTYCPEWCTTYMAWRNEEGTKNRMHKRAARKAKLIALGFEDGA
jgi:hypothetical protein